MKAFNSKGMTLVEILVATAVFTIAMAGLLNTFFTLMYLFQVTESYEVAIADLRDVMEQIKATAFTDILADFPHGITGGPSGAPYSAIVGNYTLTNENITVTYANVAAEPLEIKVSVQWSDSKGRLQQVSTSTLKRR